MINTVFNVIYLVQIYIVQSIMYNVYYPTTHYPCTMYNVQCIYQPGALVGWLRRQDVVKSSTQIVGTPREYHLSGPHAPSSVVGRLKRSSSEDCTLLEASC